MNQNESKPADAELPSPEGLSDSDLVDAIYGMTADQREVGTVIVNRWGWPPELEQFKPHGFDDMGDREKFADPMFQSVRAELGRWVSPVARSWAWWRIASEGRTAQDHREWWPKDTSAAPAPSIARCLSETRQA